MVGSGGICGIEVRAPIFERAAVIVAAVILAMAAFIVMFGIEGIPGIPMGRFIGKLGTGSGRGKDRGVGAGVGREVTVELPSA